jgi:hypothetical protein
LFYYRSPEEIFKAFDPTDVKFNPSIPVVRKKERTKSKPIRFHSSFETSLDADSNVVNEESVSKLNFFGDWSAKAEQCKEEELTDELLDFGNQLDDDEGFRSRRASTRSTMSGKPLSKMHRRKISSNTESLGPDGDAVKSE